GAHLVLSSVPNVLVAEVARRVGASPLVPGGGREGVAGGAPVRFRTMRAGEAAGRALLCVRHDRVGGDGGDVAAAALDGGHAGRVRSGAAEAVRVDAAVLQGTAGGGVEWVRR